MGRRLNLTLQARGHSQNSVAWENLWSQRWPLGEECLRTVGDESVGLFVEGGNAPGYTWPTGVLPVPGCRACVRERKVRQQLHDGLLCGDDAPSFRGSRGDGRGGTRARRVRLRRRPMRPLHHALCSNGNNRFAKS